MTCFRPVVGSYGGGCMAGWLADRSIDLRFRIFFAADAWPADPEILRSESMQPASQQLLRSRIRLALLRTTVLHDACSGRAGWLAHPAGRTIRPDIHPHPLLTAPQRCPVSRQRLYTCTTGVISKATALVGRPARVVLLVGFVASSYVSGTAEGVPSLENYY